MGHSSEEIELQTGLVLPFAGSAIPTGWLECDGKAYLKTQYPGLSDAIGTAFGGNTTHFNVPDLRGNFIRGWDHGAGRDPDAASRTTLATGGAIGNLIGSYQDDELESHAHSYYRGASSTSGTGSTALNTEGSSTTGAAGGSSETRPKNVYLMYIIKT